MGRLSDLLIEQIKSINTEEISSWSETEDLTSKVVEEQKVYFWIRLFLKEESSNIEIGDDIIIKWIHSGETLDTKFICFDKTGLSKDHDDLEKIINFNPEDDKKILCLMVDEKTINYSDEIPFIRTLFKNGRHYEYQLVKRDELLFINKRTNEVLEYFDTDF